MNKNISPIAIAPLLLGSISCSNEAPSGEQPSGERPNIIYIMTDDHSFQTLSAYGHPISRLAPTPNLDRLAAEGMLFRQAFVENSISAPSRATLLTGMYSHHHGQRTLQYGIMDTTVTLFPELLQRSGYNTAIIGKWHLSIEPRGFDHFDIFWDQGEYYNPVMRTEKTNGEYLMQKGYATEIVTDHAIAWLEEQKESDKPFCLMVHHKAPHRNWMPAMDDITLYEDITFPEPETLFDDYATRGEQMQQQQLTIDRDLGFAFDFKVPELKDEPTHEYIKASYDISMSTLTPEERAKWDSTYAVLNKDFLSDMPQGDSLLRWKYQRYIHDYCRTIHAVDEQVGRLLDYLKESGLDRNTVIVYTSDQGFYMGEHGLYDKRFMYEEALRTPLIVSWPGHVRAGVETKAMVQNIDYAPTLLDLAGVHVPEEMDGESFRGILLNEGKAPSGWRKYIYYQYYDFPAVGNVRKHYGIRDGRYKLIHWKDDECGELEAIDQWEMYDLKEDPTEVNNIYGSRKSAIARRRLSRRMAAMRQDIDIFGQNPLK